MLSRSMIKQTANAINMISSITVGLKILHQRENIPYSEKRGK
jgi:hypothetical protein